MQKHHEGCLFDRHGARYVDEDETVAHTLRDGSAIVVFVYASDTYH
jgi:hypothetical protein